MRLAACIMIVALGESSDNDESSESIEKRWLSVSARELSLFSMIAAKISTALLYFRLSSCHPQRSGLDQRE